MKIAFGVVIYNQAVQWMDEFIESINNQLYRDFDLVIINDGVNEKDVYRLKKINNKIIIVNSPNYSTMSYNRVLLIKTAVVNEYDLLIFGDFDDTFSNNRVSEIVDNMDDKYTFYYNKLVCNNNQVFNSIPYEISNISDILQYNFLGMSNTAINLHNISIDWLETLIDVKTNIFDWYFYSRLLIDGFSGKYIKDCFTEYRQSENNIAGIQINSNAELIREYKIKKYHYSLLKSRCLKILNLYNIYNCFDESQIPNKYLEHERNGFWWENIIVNI